MLYCSRQVDTWGKRFLVGISFAYVGIVLLLPFVNVFYQARFFPPFHLFP